MSETPRQLWLRDSFESDLADILDRHDKQVLSRDGVITAAVLIPLFWKEGRIHVLLTRRSNEVAHHKGEISFPGGKLDHDDPSLLHCALRETHEEVGIEPADVLVVGELDDFYTVATHYLVVPFVGMIPYPYEMTMSEREIHEIITVPLEVFVGPTWRSEETWNLDGRPIEVVFYDWRGYRIWGATARILKHFTRLLDRWSDLAV